MFDRDLHASFLVAIKDFLVAMQKTVAKEGFQGDPQKSYAQESAMITKLKSRIGLSQVTMV